MKARSAPYWGVYNLERQPKFAFEGPVVAILNGACWPSVRWYWRCCPWP